MLRAAGGAASGAGLRGLRGLRTAAPTAAVPGRSGRAPGAVSGGPRRGSAPCSAPPVTPRCRAGTRLRPPGPAAARGDRPGVCGNRTPCAPGPAALGGGGDPGRRYPRGLGPEPGLPVPALVRTAEREQRRRSAVPRADVACVRAVRARGAQNGDGAMGDGSAGERNRAAARLWCGGRVKEAGLFSSPT